MPKFRLNASLRNNKRKRKRRSSINNDNNHDNNINLQIPHWNEEHTGNKYSIVLYRSGAKRKKVEAIMAGIKNKGKDKVDNSEP